MTRALAGRLAQAALVVLLVVSATFLLVRFLPGDPFAAVTLDDQVPEAVRAELVRGFGLDRPVGEQYLRFVAHALRGDLGWSVGNAARVRDVLADRLPATLLLAAAAILLGFGGGIALGAWQGWRPDSRLARASDRAGLIVLSIPEFVLALLLVLGPALALGLFPVGRMRDDFAPDGLAGVLDVAHHLALPALALGLVLAALVARHQRSAMRAVRDAEFVRAARARGVGEARLAVRHALRNALVPVLTLGGVIVPSLLGGTALVETVFNWPGMGFTAVDAVVRRDYHLVVGCVLVSSICVVAGTLVADLALLWADPRLRRAR